MQKYACFSRYCNENFRYCVTHASSHSAGRLAEGKKKFKVTKGTLKDLAMEYLHTCVHDASVSTLQDFHYITVS